MNRREQLAGTGLALAGAMLPRTACAYAEADYTIEIALHDQQRQIFVVTDLNVSPKWEFTFGVGLAPTSATDRRLIKAIIGRRFDWGRHPEVE